VSFGRTISSFVLKIDSFLFQLPGIPKNGSVPTFDRVRKHSTGERFKPSLAAIKASSRGDVTNGDVRTQKSNHLKVSRISVAGSIKDLVSTLFTHIFERKRTEKLYFFVFF
jgi:hypothetical protein